METIPLSQRNERWLGHHLSVADELELDALPQRIRDMFEVKYSNCQSRIRDLHSEIARLEDIILRLQT